MISVLTSLAMALMVVSTPPMFVMITIHALLILVIVKLVNAYLPLLPVKITTLVPLKNVMKPLDIVTILT